MASEKASPVGSTAGTSSAGPTTAPGFELSGTEPTDECAWLRGQLVRAVRYYCPGWLSNVSEDLVQTAMIRVLEARRKSSDPRAISSAYLYRAAYTALVNEIRKRRRRNEVPMDEEAIAPSELSSPTTPERTLTARETGEAIRFCLSLLRRERKLAVTLHLQGHTIPEAAEVLKWSSKRTENLIYRGLGDLRKCLLSKGVTP